MTDKAPLAGKDHEKASEADRSDDPQHDETDSESGHEQEPLTFRPPQPESESENGLVNDVEAKSQAPVRPETREADKEEEDEEEEEADKEEEEEEDDYDDEEDDDDDEEDDEPRLKYARLTQHLGAVYRNGDATSSFFVAGDKMVCEPRTTLRLLC
jgi:hypothetical protein